MAIDLTPFRVVEITIYYQQPKAEKLQNADSRMGCQALVFSCPEANNPIWSGLGVLTAQIGWAAWLVCLFCFCFTPDVLRGCFCQQGVVIKGSIKVIVRRFCLLFLLLISTIATAEKCALLVGINDYCK